MENATTYHDAGLLTLRICLAFLFLSGAIVHTKDAQGRNSAIHFTTLLFMQSALGRNSGLMRAIAFLSVATLYIGGLGVLLGIEIKIAAALMFAFAACGWLIHMRDGRLALEAANLLEQRIPAEAAAINRVKFSAFGGNASSAIKNIPVMGSAVLIMLEGGGSYCLSNVLGIPALW